MAGANSWVIYDPTQSFEWRGVMTKDQELEKAARGFAERMQTKRISHAEWQRIQNAFIAGSSFEKSRKPVGELVFDSRESAFQENCHGETSAARLADYCNNKIRKALSTETQGGGK